MFGKKPEQQNQTIKPDVKITKMPDDFYAGSNPIIKFQSIEKIVNPTKIEKAVLSSADKKLLDQKTAAGSGNKLHPMNLFTSWKFLIASGLVILVFGGLVIGFYYWWQYRQTSQTSQQPTQPVISEPVITEPTISNETPTTVAPDAEAPVVYTDVKLDFPSSLLGDSVDTDKDNITDLAEELFGTDPAVPDTDGDKFTDGHEVFYLYNPAGKEPLKLIDSSLVSVYTNPAFMYKVYYPKSWAVGNVDTNYKDVLFSTLTGENIEVRVMDMNPGETFNDWFARNATNEQLSDYVSFESVFKEFGFVRKDNLVYFIQKGNQIFAILYHTTDSSVVNYRIIVEMLARSFQFGNSSEVQARPVEESFNNFNSTVSTTTSTSL